MVVTCSLILIVSFINRFGVAIVTLPDLVSTPPFTNIPGTPVTATPGFYWASFYTSFTPVYSQTTTGTGIGGKGSNSGSTQSSSTMREIVAVKVDKLEHRLIPGDPVYARSQLECLVHCAQQLECMSFFYQTLSQTCHIHDIVFISRNDTEPSERTSYYVVGDKTDCPVFDGFYHKRSLNFCYQIVLQAMNVTQAERTCSDLGGEFGFHLTPDMYAHLTTTLEGSFLLRKRKFWTGMKFNETSEQFTFNGGSKPEFDKWLHGAGPPVGEENECIQTEPDISWLWEVSSCDKTRAFVCRYK